MSYGKYTNITCISQVAPSTSPPIHAQPEINCKHPAAPTNNRCRYTLRHSASPSNPEKQCGRKDTYREISCENEHSINSDDKGRRPTKRRKPCAALALILVLYARGCRFSVPPLTTTFERDDTQA